MQPMNYTIDVAGAGDVLGGLRAGQDVRGRQQQYRMNEAAEARAQELQPLAVEGAGLRNEATRQAIEAQRAQMQRQQEFQSAIGGLAQLGASATVDDFARVSMQFPELSRGLMETFDALDDTRKRGTVQVLGAAATAIKGGNVQRAITLTEDYAKAAEQAGDPQGAATARGMAEIMKSEPDAALASLGLAIHNLDPKTAEFIFGGGEGRVQRSEILPGGLIVSADAQGRPVVTTAGGETLTGQAAAEAIAEAEDRGIQLEYEKNLARGAGSNVADIETGEQAKSAQALGAKRFEFVGGAMEGVQSITSNISNLQRAIELVDAGAATGTIQSRLPALDAATKELRNLKARLGLDVVGSVTFGALSANELDLALNVALPDNLEGDDLKRWLTDKITSQEKVRAALSEQAAFLANPNNTLEMWIERVNQATTNPTPLPPPSGRATPAASGQPSYMGLLNR